MKKLILLFYLFSYSYSGLAQESCKIVTDEKSGKQMLLGIAERQALKDTSFSWWVDPEYEYYEPRMEDLEGVADSLKGYDITAVMGTWCSDTRREIPRLLKTLDTLGFPEKKLKMIMVGRDKKGPEGETEGLNITLVPTIILYKDGNEMGRITEAPIETLEKDIANIVFHRPLKKKIEKADKD